MVSVGYLVIIVIERNMNSQRPILQTSIDKPVVVVVPTEPNQAQKWRYIVVIGRPGSATNSVGGTFEPLCSHMSESSQTVLKVPSSSNTNVMQTLGMEIVFREAGYIYSCNCQPLNSQWAVSHWAKCWGFKADCVQICSIPDNFK